MSVGDRTASEWPDDLTPETVERAIEVNDLRRLTFAAIDAGLNSEDLQWAYELCIRLSVHADPAVRGNALLGFGYLARRFRVLPDDRFRELISTGLRDDDLFVADHAYDAAEDIELFLNRDS